MGNKLIFRAYIAIVGRSVYTYIINPIPTPQLQYSPFAHLSQIRTSKSTKKFYLYLKIYTYIWPNKIRLLYLKQKKK